MVGEGIYGVVGEGIYGVVGEGVVWVGEGMV